MVSPSPNSAAALLLVVRALSVSVPRSVPSRGRRASPLPGDLRANNTVSACELPTWCVFFVRELSDSKLNSNKLNRLKALPREQIVRAQDFRERRVNKSLPPTLGRRELSGVSFPRSDRSSSLSSPSILPHRCHEHLLTAGSPRAATNRGDDGNQADLAELQPKMFKASAPARDRKSPRSAVRSTSSSSSRLTCATATS